MWYSNEEETMREELMGEIGMHQHTTNVLYQLLAEACRERDEAKQQLKKSMAEVSELKQLLNKLLPPFQTNSTADSCIRPRMSRDSGHGRFPIGECSSIGKVIDTLIKGKPLPERGRLLEAVVETAPLLETLMITGQVPNWRNPPPLPFNLDATDFPAFQTLKHSVNKHC
ncbi:hypothetical protein V6N13_024732 [Hibiscus sabdariffa]|uniref:Uncharacterized protein n=2 Tax=Hibiscus sabdariffa TaxID=183260 RepID=A0ABR2QG68_9ROSI